MFAISYISAFWRYITDHGNFGVALAHALYHVTLSRGVQNNHSYEIFDPYLPIHYATFMRLRWRLRDVLRAASPLLSDFRPKFCPVKMVHKMVLIRENLGLNIRFYVRDPEKAHPCAEPRVLCVQICTKVQWYESLSIWTRGCSQMAKRNRTVTMKCLTKHTTKRRLPCNESPFNWNNKSVTLLMDL